MEKLAKLESEKSNKLEQTKQQIGNKLKNLSEQERALEGLKLRELDPALLEIVKKAEDRTKAGLTKQKSENATLAELERLW